MSRNEQKRMNQFHPECSEIGTSNLNGRVHDSLKLVQMRETKRITENGVYNLNKFQYEHKLLRN